MGDHDLVIAGDGRQSGAGPSQIALLNGNLERLIPPCQRIAP
jgi:hypothetical protein